MSSPAESDPATGHVRLILLHDENSSFHLDIPLEIIESLCLKPLKYLLFLGWCILGVEGVLAYERDGNEIDTDGNLGEHEIYYFVGPDDADLACAVDLEVIRGRTHVPSETTGTRDDFRQNLMDRDPYCVWTGVSHLFSSGMHIIPHRRGSEWLQLIVENRPQYGEDVTTLRDINDIRNGFFAMDLIRRSFDPRCLAILKVCHTCPPHFLVSSFHFATDNQTPNHILEPTEVPPRHHQPNMPSTIRYPSHDRYTLQWLINPEPAITPTIPNNIDAAFKTGSRKPKPSDLLLHYNYGAAAVKRWGHGTDLLKNLANPVSPLMGSSKTVHDRNIAITKRGRRLRSRGGRGGRGGRGRKATAGDGEVVEASWDEDDVILFCWGNSPAAKKRHRKKVEGTTHRMEAWREGVSQGSA